MLKLLIFLYFLLIGVVFCESEDDYDDDSPVNYRFAATSSSQVEAALPQGYVRKCPPEWKFVEDYSKCLFETPPLEWHKAEKYCVDQGAHLMSINGKDSIRPAFEMVKRIWFWIGLFQSVDDKGYEWKFTNNQTINYIPWTHDLVIPGPSTCASANDGIVTQDYPCETLFPGICQLNVLT